MDLDKIIAALHAATGSQTQDTPLISASAYVLPNSSQPNADKEAARRMVAAFVYWIVAYAREAPNAPPERAESLASITSRPDQSAKIIEELGDNLTASDVAPAWKSFASAYLAPGPGQLGDDYFKLFVEAPGRRTLRDAFPVQAEYEQLATLIESRGRRFQEGAADWNKPLDLVNGPQPSLWQGGTREEWLWRLASYEDLTDTPPQFYRARVVEYWSLVDAAPSMPYPDVAAGLVRTFLWVNDAGIQQAVYRALGTFPSLVAVEGILANIANINLKTSWGDSVVDMFPEDLDKTELTRLADAINAAPLEQQSAYRTALILAAATGSRHASELHEVLEKR